MLKISTFEVTPIQQNARILWDPDTKSALAIDPGGEADNLMKFLKTQGLTLEQIWLTHSHLDHCGGVKGLKRETKAALFAHPNEREMRGLVEALSGMYGLQDTDMENCPEPDTYIEGGEILHFAGRKFQVIFAPGHSPGHVVFYSEEGKFLLGGDVLFAGSIGRTDLPGGDYALLMESIKGILNALPPGTQVLPGHGPSTTLAAELQSNPFLRDL